VLRELASHALTWGLTATTKEAQDVVRPGNNNDMATPAPLVDAILQQNPLKHPAVTS
jgi:hypothetical protein